MKFLRGIGVNANNKQTNAIGGLWPSVFNLATKAVISVNATCGEGGREEFCRMLDGPSRSHFNDGNRDGLIGGNSGRCGVCDNFSRDSHKRHPINYGIDDGTNRWWQSPPIFYGAQYEYVTITLDLKQVYQVAYVTIKAANSPRPGAWILERSIDGVAFDAWQHFATSDKDCIDRYGIPARKGKPHYFTDTEVICTSFHSKLAPMENGEIHTFLIHGRPGANETSPELLQFTKARYVRFRFQGLRGKVEPLPSWLSQDINRDKKLFYSIRDVRIGGQCVCNGHASNCRHNVASGNLECECGHHTCGPNCDRCCPMFNQRQWGPGTSRDARICLPCNCHGHAKSCRYDEDVDRSGRSLDAGGYYQGGGVCDNCTKHTSGINCEQCVPGYYRPFGTEPESEVPCLKCDCDPFGSTGECALEGNLLTCQCRPGYAGLRCDTCDLGYRGYPNCEQCPCNQRGSLMEMGDGGGNCEGECSCKANVEGKYCDRCKVGYFSLQTSNPEGCSACYCSGVTSVCSSAYLQPQIYAFNNQESWLVTDISVKEIETPIMDDRGMLTVGNNEIIGIEAYYWLAPEQYNGNKLSLYGSNILYKVHWVVMRGDTSGKPTTGPNIILVGQNGMRIACGDDYYTNSNMTFLIPLDEYHESWYHVPDDVDDIITRLRRTEYKGDRVSRTQFMSVLNDIKHILLRAKFHTDQIEVSLEEVVIYSGNFTDGYSPVEECSCPSGYTGLSCEFCQYGHVRVYGNTTTHETQGFCVKCDCNGHSESCNSDTGECQCEHNTIGEQCERCGAGFYGNPLLGTPNDCKKCACPLVDDDNNFSPSCQLDSLSISNDDVEPGYVCTQCPRGYTGDHCEICDDGHFGVPSAKGGKCEQCSCGGGPCDRITGQCLSCRGNTEGWKCDRCKEGFYGNPAEGCTACLCDSLGSIFPNCNNNTGECECKEHFIGRTCNKCEIGYGNVTALCVECNCDLVGSTTNVCDQNTGMCDCQPGVEGFRCDACQHLHYGFSATGCTSCNCSQRGSELSTCHIATGQCRCRPNYVGLTCDKCRDGYYDCPQGCNKCNCNEEGSESSNCNAESGNCRCKPGVEGKTCNACKPGYYGFSKNGCKECEVCNKKGHICDQETGRCACPPNSHGEFCTHCKPNHWGFEPNVGCRACNCSDTGSIRSQCDLRTSTCTCQQGYTGIKCDQCVHGYYGYPKCRRCSCHYPGTHIQAGSCDATGVCQCDIDGNCPCKDNVMGRRCNKCKEGTFGLHLDNLEGCTECFCFGRSKECVEAGYTWSKIRMKSRTLHVGFIDNNNYGPSVQTPVFLDTNNFEEIENTEGNVTKSHDHFNNPLYWRLPKQYTADRILSYGGYLRFTTTTYPQPTYHGDFTEYPIARIEGNGIRLIHYPNHASINDKYEVRLHESNWRRETLRGTTELMLPVTRDILMVTLQHVNDIFIKASDYRLFENVTLSEVTLDSGIKVHGNPPPLAMGVELCECPREYNGTSCQNPSLGNYREKHIHHVYNNTNDIDIVIGKSTPCSCNERSNVCDVETGHCFACIDNTAGDACEKCAEGHYGDPATTKCHACACPTVQQNFATSCVPNSRGNHFMCRCKPGYYGPTCDRCSTGYYGQPHLPGGSCKPCNCNTDGSTNLECDSISGECTCKPGIIGSKCSECSQNRHILENNQCVLCDDCIQILLDDLDALKSNLANNTSHLESGTLQPPWQSLTNLEKRYLHLSEKVDVYLDDKDKLNEVIEDQEIENIENDVYALKDVFNDKSNSSRVLQTIAREQKNASIIILQKIEQTRFDLQGLKKTLSEFGTAHISTKDALKRGQKLYAEIKKQKTKINAMPKVFGKIRRHCETSYKKVEVLANNSTIANLNKLKVRHDNLLQRTKAMEVLIREVQQKNDNGTRKNFNNKDKLVQLQAKYKNIHDEANSLDKLLTEQGNLINDTKEKLNGSAIAGYEELHDLIDRLDERISDDYFEKLAKDRKRLADHNKMLSEKAREYEEDFAKFDNELNSLKASGKFKESTLQLIEDANKMYQTAKEMFDVLQKSYFEPTEGDTLADNSSIADADSERLQKRIENIRDFASEINQKLKKLENSINTLKQQNWDNGLANNNQTDKLNQLKVDKEAKLKKMKEIEDIIRKAVNSLEQSREIHKAATDLNITMRYNLLKNYEKFLNLSSAENIKKFKNNIRFTKVLLQNVSKYDGTPTNIDVLNEGRIVIDKFNSKKASIEEKLAKLRNNIKKANQISSTIMIPLSGSNCGRRYKLRNLEPSSKFDLSLTFTYNTTNKNIQILFSLYNDKEFIKLQTQNGHLQFIWKSDKRQTRSWELINTVYNFVVSIDHIQKTLKLQLTNSEVISTNFTFFGHDTLEIGMNHDFELEESKTTGIPGCIKDLFINGRQMGLWEFEETFGTCESCSTSRNLELQHDKSIIRFNGDSYIAFKKLKANTPKLINMQFKIRTFDENATLLFIYAEGSYVAITLRNGHIRFEMHYKSDPEKSVLYNSKDKSNNGNEVSIEFTKVYDNDGFDRIQFKENGIEHVWSSLISKSNLIKILKGDFYIGGFPPDFDKKKLPSDFASDSLVGLIINGKLADKDLYLEGQDYQIYGVEYAKSTTLSYDQILLDKPASYVKLNQENNQLKGPISFILRTQSKNGDILQINSTLGTLVVALEDGRLQVSKNGNVFIKSNDIISSDDYSLIVLDEKLCNLFIDGIAANEHTDCKNEPLSEETGIKIQIGGTNSILGIIKELIINSIEVKVTTETYQIHENAQIGRTKHVESQRKRDKSVKKYKAIDEKINNDISMKDMSPALCERVSYTFEPNAFKFGDSQRSYITYTLPSNFWKTNCTIEFEFRTFNNAGLLFLSHGNDHYNMLILRNGKVELLIKGKRERPITKSKIRVDDGKWHRIVLDMQVHYSGLKKKRRLKLNVDGELQKSKMLQNKINNLLFIGNIPEQVSKNYLVEPFRGCIRSIKINHVQANFFNEKKAKRFHIGQCFSNIERGSYFRGDSYAIYDHEFKLNNYLNIAFDFRTDQQNGILLSVSHLNNRPALSIELQNGAVVMSVDMGHGLVTNVTNNFARNSACNNEWHKVNASFTTELSVIVDDVTQTWVLNGLDDMKPIEAPLYIGGLPDTAPGGTLKIRENFKGCIRNLTIDNKLVDWAHNTTELVNVSVNSCPVNAPSA